MNPQKNILFIINPISGMGKQKNILKSIETDVDKEKFEYKVITTEGPGQATILCRQAVIDNVDIVVAVGGDGTVNEIGQALVGTNTALAIIPTGSGNGLARHLKIPFGFKKAIQVINEAKLHKIDTATVNGKVFLSMAGVGYEAFVAKKFAKAPKRGFLTYFRIVSGEYPLYKPKKYTLLIDGKKITRKALSISFANSNQFGNNASVDPKAELDDGYIDVCIIRRIPIYKIPFFVPMLFTKTFHKTQYIEIIRVKTVTIERTKGKSIHFDGDPFKMGDTLEMKINPLSLNVVIP